MKKCGQTDANPALNAIPANFLHLSSNNSKNSKPLLTAELDSDNNELQFGRKTDPYPSALKNANEGLEDARSLTSEQEWLTTEQAAAYLQISVGSLRNMTSNGHIPYYKLQGRNRYRLSELRNLLLSQKRGGF